MNTLSFMQTRKMLMQVADKVIENKRYLTEIDSRIGDGDHGIGMYNGMTKGKEALAKMDSGENVYQLFSEMGKAMLMSMGGASGVIFGTMFMGGAKRMPAQQVLSSEGLAQLMEFSLLAVKARGKAEIGDKTMVDAFEPAVLAMKEHYARGLVPMLERASSAARTGMEATKEYSAKFGRAKFLMDRSIGFQDAGATSTYIIINAMYQFVKDLTEYGGICGG